MQWQPLRIFPKLLPGKTSRYKSIINIINFLKTCNLSCICISTVASYWLRYIHNTQVSIASQKHNESKYKLSSLRPDRPFKSYGVNHLVFTQNLPENYNFLQACMRFGGYKTLVFLTWLSCLYY